MSRDVAPFAYHEYFEYRRYPLRVPPLDNGIDPVRHPVAIVGGGPIGLSLALGLARHGVRSIVIEADDAVSYGSRAACISRRSLEIFDRLGVAQTCSAALRGPRGRATTATCRCTGCRCRWTRTSGLRRW
jgi:3-(3-hydroxy-phenyl)propionate hydroxylase